MKKYNILSLDGGGIRGVMLLQQLVELEKKMGCPLNEKFDLISGTSTGAIIAILLSIGNKSEDILEMYKKHSGGIFKKRFFRWGLFRPKYNDNYINKLLKEKTKGLMLSDLNKCDVIVTAYNATKREKILFKSKNAKEDKNNDYKLFDVARASSSAQTFFKPHKINKEYYIDGGMVINNPSLVSYIDALNLDKTKNINVLSFSTGIVTGNVNDKVVKGGSLRWAQPTVNILLSEQALITDYHMKSLSNFYKNVSYVRCNSFIDKSSGEIDDASKENIINLIEDGKKSAINNRQLIDLFLSKI